jgi:site-specific DNA recombinase
VTATSIIYTRVSTDEQADKGYSLPHQVSECRRYALNNDFVVLAEFYDDYSGATLERPGFSELREFMAQNRVDAVIVYAADRLSRNIIDFLVLRDQWEKAGIELHYVDRGKSQNNFEGLLADGIFALIAHGERLKIIERTTNGRHSKARNNRVVMTGIPPYGYKRKGKGRDAVYIIDPTEAQVVQNIFDWYVNGYGQKGPLSLRAISNVLDEMGVMPPRYGARKVAPFWHSHTIAVILKNTIYIGTTYYGKVKTQDGKRTPRPKSEWIPIEVPHLAIVSNEIFEEAAKRVLRNIERSKRNRKRPYLLSGHLRCGACGNVMFGYVKTQKETRVKDYYRCGSGVRKRFVCSSPRKELPVPRVDNAVWEWVTSLLENENYLDEGIRAMVEKQEKELGPKKERLLTIENLLTAADTRIERLVDELSEYEGYAVRDVIREKIIALEGERNMLFDERERLSRELELSDISPDFEEQIKRTTAKIREKLAGATYEDKRIVLDALELRVEYYYDECRGKILKISCVIPFMEGEIAVNPSPRWLPFRCRCWIVGPVKNRR